jgi:hypothetical protein
MERESSGEGDMVDAAIQHELTTCLEQLPIQKQQRVLEYARALTAASPVGTKGADLLRFAGTISETDLDEMSRAVESGCERVDDDEW